MLKEKKFKNSCAKKDSPKIESHAKLEKMRATLKDKACIPLLEEELTLLLANNVFSSCKFNN